MTLSAVAPSGGTTVNLSSNNAAATVPGSVTVAAGSTRADFTISTRTVSIETNVTLTAVAGTDTRTVSLTVTAIRISALTMSKPEIGASFSAPLTVQLVSAAVPGGTTVTLASSDSAATVPASVVVPVGLTSALADVRAGNVTSPRVVTITGSAGGETRSTTVTILPVFLSFVGQTNDFVTRGTTRRLESPGHSLTGHGTTGYVTLTATSNAGPAAIDDWSLDLWPARGQALAPGHFVAKTAFDGPWLSFGGASRGCTATSAEFQILEVAFGPNEKLLRFHATFSQLCSSNTPALQPTTGEVWFGGGP